MTDGRSHLDQSLWTETLHGGWTEARPSAMGQALFVVGLDVRSCFPLLAHLIGWWPVLCAEAIGAEDLTASLRRLCRRAIADPRVLLRRDVFERFGVVLVEGVLPRGEHLCVEVEDARRPDGRLEVLPVTSLDRTFTLTAMDVLLAAVKSRRVPSFDRATRLVPIGRQPGIRARLTVLPGLVLDLSQDPVLALVRHRWTAQAGGDHVLAALLRVVVNALVFGNFCRFDEVRRKIDGAWTTTEVPGPFCFVQIASCVTAASRLVLAILDRMVTDLGGLVAYRDTDGVLVLASPNGGQVTLRDGTTVRELSWAEVDVIVDAFEALSPEPDWPFWKVERGTVGAPRQSAVFGPKRHGQWMETPEGPCVVSHAEVALGGFFADPPSMQGRADDGHRLWSSAAVARELRRVAATGFGEASPRPEAPWDEP